MSSRIDTIVIGFRAGLVTRKVNTSGWPTATERGLVDEFAPSCTVGASGLTAFTAFLTTTPGAVPKAYATSVLVSVVFDSVSSRVIVAVFLYWPAAMLMFLTPADVYSHVSPGSRKPLLFVSPPL